MPEPCRCGFVRVTDATPVHPCHGNGYTCGREAVERFYVPGPHLLSGSTLKVSAAQTWACDDCWLKFTTKWKLVNLPMTEEIPAVAEPAGSEESDEETEAWFPYDR